MPCWICLHRTFTSSQVSIEARRSGVLLYKKDQSSFSLILGAAEVQKSDLCKVLLFRNLFPLWGYLGLGFLHLSVGKTDIQRGG